MPFTQRVFIKHSCNSNIHHCAGTVFSLNVKLYYNPIVTQRLFLSISVQQRLVGFCLHLIFLALCLCVCVCE